MKFIGTKLNLIILEKDVFKNYNVQLLKLIASYMLQFVCLTFDEKSCRVKNKQGLHCIT